MEQSVVVLMPLDTYDQPQVDEAVRQGVALLGGPDKFVSSEEKILLKPNLLGKALPQKAVTTHYAVFAAVAKLLREAGCSHLRYGDSPGNPTVTPDKAAKASGIADAAAKFGVEAADFSSGSMVHFPEGHRARSFYLCNGVQEADAVINLPKMKTHALERITGAMKNLYGCICGVNKATGHAMFPDSEVFADMLADLQRCVKPRLHILDGVIAMEGNGPTSGTPIAMNMLLLSADPVALDSVFAAMVSLSPALVPTCVSGSKAGIGVMDEQAILVRTSDGDLSVTEAAARYGKPEFDVFRGTLKKGLISKLMPLLPMLQQRPKVDKSRCIACGICEEACPVPSKAVHSGHGKKAHYDYRKCIRCYCCQEMCPAKAIHVYRSPLNKLLG